MSESNQLLNGNVERKNGRTWRIIATVQHRIRWPRIRFYNLFSTSVEDWKFLRRFITFHPATRASFGKVVQHRRLKRLWFLIESIICYGMCRFRLNSQPRQSPLICDAFHSRFFVRSSCYEFLFRVYWLSLSFNSSCDASVFFISPTTFSSYRSIRCFTIVHNNNNNKFCRQNRELEFFSFIPWLTVKIPN